MVQKRTRTRVPKNGTIVFVWCTVICFTLMGMMSILAAQNQEPQHDSLEYDVDVSAQIIPIYAVDKDGNPVFDLKQKEIELYINGKKQNLLFFSNYQLEETVPATQPATQPKTKTEAASQEEAPKPARPTIKKQPEKPKSPERIVIIILDGISNSSSGVRNAKKLAKGIIDSGSPGDAFVIFISTIKKGLQYIAGPEKNKRKLNAVLDKLYQNPQWIVLIPKKNWMRFENAEAGERMEWSILNELYGLDRDNTTGQYTHAMRNFNKSLKELKYALKTIRLPKHIFLVSGGVQEMATMSNSANEIPGSVTDFDQTSILGYYGMLKEAAVSINQGGSLLYLVNPIKVTTKNRRAVNTMKRISNAQFISGDNVNDMLTKVKKNTAAYYEIGFAITKKTDENFSIKIKSTRKGVKLNTLKFGEKSRPYAQMDDTMKKLFALNVVMGGNWGRMIAKVSIAKYQKLPEQTSPTAKTIKVTVPKELQGKIVDVFTLNIQPKTMKADIQLTKRVPTATETIEIPIQNKRIQFFVLINPITTRAIVNKVL